MLRGRLRRRRRTTRGRGCSFSFEFPRFSLLFGQGWAGTVFHEVLLVAVVGGFCLVVEAIATPVFIVLFPINEFIGPAWAFTLFALVRHMPLPSRFVAHTN